MQNKLFVAIFIIVCLCACKTPTNINYFQDVTTSSEVKMQAEQCFRLRPEDKVNIIVNSKDAELEALFTLTTTGQRSVLGASATPRTVAGRSNTSSTTQPVAYTVDNNGDIDFPILGKLHVAGMTRMELAAYIKGRLVGENHVNDAIVTVEYVNIGISVLGEVKNSGRFDITKDHYTILDAIAQSGDLTINGQRENVMVIRREGDVEKTYLVNLCSQQELLSSPAYFLQQDDIVYVSPNDKRKRESTVSGNTVLTPSFWISIASLLTTITALIIR